MANPCSDQSERSQAPQTEADVDVLTDSDLGERFDTWYRERQKRQNIEDGKSYFNSLRSPKADARHGPSQLLQCQRKQYYRARCAPAESEVPTGTFWNGDKVETEIVLPFLRAVLGDDQYVQNSLWVSFSITADETELEFRGETDPVVVDNQGNPVLVTEIKTSRRVKSRETASPHHLAQIHAYMYGLSQKSSEVVRDGVILYVDRETFDLQSFPVEFDPKFWRETVVSWAEEQSHYRGSETLPSAEPHQEWECRYCPYRERCGRGTTSGESTSWFGIIPEPGTYPHDRLESFLRSHPESRLPPNLASEHPDLADRYGTYNWECEACGNSVPYDFTEGDGGVDDDLQCSKCAKSGIPAQLRSPPPDRQAEISLGAD